MTARASPKTGVVRPSGSKNRLRQRSANGWPVSFLQEQRQQHVVGLVVAPRRARGELHRAIGQQCQRVRGVPGQHRPGHRVFHDVGQARRVAHQLANGDRPPGRRQVGQMTADRIVEGDPSGLRLRQDRQGGERLGGGVDLEQGPVVHGDPELHVGQPVATDLFHPTPTHHRQGQPGNPAAFHRGPDEGIDCWTRVLGGGERRWERAKDGKRREHRQGSHGSVPGGVVAPTHPGGAGRPEAYASRANPVSVWLARFFVLPLGLTASAVPAAPPHGSPRPQCRPAPPPARPARMARP